MKKILAIAMTVAMILCLGTVFASAAQPNLGGTEAQYSGGSYEQFSKLGDIEVTWMPDAMEKLNLKDGDLADWQELGLEATVITPANMVSWNGLHAVPEGFQMSAYFMADKDYLYVGFYIVDPDVVAIDPANLAGYTAGDAFQINIDFGRKLGWIIENDPDTAEILTNTQNVFYSFGYNGDDGPVGVFVQCSDDERLLVEETGVIGSTGKTSDGWCAEFTIPFAEMYKDYLYKAYLDDEADNAVYVDSQNPFLLGAGLYYQDHATQEDGSTPMTWASGTHSGFAGSDADGNLLDPATNPPVVRWDVYDNAMNLILNYTEGMEFTCNGIVVEGDEYQTAAPDPEETKTDAEETKADAEETKADAEETKADAEETKADAEETKADAESADDTEADEEAESTADTKADAESTADTKADAETKAEAKGGCGSVIGLGAVAIIAAAAAAVVLKKKD